MTETALQRTPLYDEHVRLGGKMVPFAGYDMPVHYPTGIMAEHNWTRAHAGLFDVSHMGQCFISAAADAAVASALERLVPADIAGLAPDQSRYTQLLNADGGVLDDLIVTRSSLSGDIDLVVNAGRKEADFAHIEAHLPEGAVLEKMNDALFALQGPTAENVLAALNPRVRDIPFMHRRQLDLGDCDGVYVWRSGYTGEDGFEVSVMASDATKLWSLLLSDPDVKPIGLGARDSLRLEAGLCLYGHELDETTSPVEADLVWSIGKRRRAEGGFIGADRVLKEIAGGTSRKRVGIKPEGRAPARDGTIVQDMAGREIGKITSGGFGPTVNGPVAMGYVETASSSLGTQILLIVRDKALPATVVKLPFVPARFKR